MSVIAIGDIHGQCGALRCLLAQILPRMRSTDTLVFLGDYIDRGPDSKGCIDEILQLKSDSRYKVVTLLGNHEQWMLRSLHNPTFHSWLIAMDALPTIASYSEHVAQLMSGALQEYGARLFSLHLPLPYSAFFDTMPPEHLEFFQQLDPFYAEPGVICAHGGAELTGDWASGDINCFVWGASGFPEEYSGTEAVIYGHHNNALISDDGSVQPCLGANKTFGIDTISYGVLTALRLPEGTIFQSSTADKS